MTTTTTNPQTPKIRILPHARIGQNIGNLTLKIQKIFGGKLHKTGTIAIDDYIREKFQKEDDEGTTGYGLHFIQLRYKDALQCVLVRDEGHKCSILGTRVMKFKNVDEPEFKFPKDSFEEEAVKKILMQVEIDPYERQE
jgi:hypothetical protein